MSEEKASPEDMGEESEGEDSIPEPIPEDIGDGEESIPETIHERSGEVKESIPKQISEESGEAKESIPEPIPERSGEGKESIPEPMPEGSGEAKESIPEPIPEESGEAKDSIPEPIPEGSGEGKESIPEPIPEGSGEREESKPEPIPEGSGEGEESKPEPIPKESGEAEGKLTEEVAPIDSIVSVVEAESSGSSEEGSDDEKTGSATPSGSDEGEASGEDGAAADDLFGQAELKAKKNADDEFRERKGTWAQDDDDNDDDAVDDDDQKDDEGKKKSVDSAMDVDDEAPGSSNAGGGMMDLLGRSKAAKEELAAKEAKEQELKKRKRKRKQTSSKDSDRRRREQKLAEKGDAKAGGSEKEVEVWVEPVYDTDQLRSKPVNTSDLVPDHILKFYESYAYDSGRPDNLHMIDDSTLIYISGNYLHFYSIPNKEVFNCRRAAEGYGLGHIALHPSRQYFAVGEKGHNPIIVVYSWPGIAVYRILRRGTVKGYSFLNFSPQGDILCSQGVDPDYMLTIWDWSKEKILLRCKAFANDVFRATFSPTLAGDLTTCGVGHIRFWKMANTFTGLKLQGAIGRFGKTEISDIKDYVELPNGKVLSGCEWGNILVWEGGLITCEICGLNDAPLHHGEITSLIMMNETNEVLTVGKDGYLRIWDVDTIDIADTLVDDSGKYPVEPTNEIRLSGDASPQGCIRSVTATPENNVWFCQDSWGRVWDVNITKAIQDNQYSPSPVFYTPGGGPVNCVTCSVEHTIMAVGTEGGHLWIIDYISKLVLVRKHYKTSVKKLFWLPQKYDPRGVTFLAALGDGCIRCYSIQPMTIERAAELEEDEDDPFVKGQPFEIGLNQVLRFSKGAITVMQFDEENEILYICGEDRSLWGVYLFYDEEEDCSVMEPLASFTTPFVIYHLDLHPLKNYRMIIAGKTARVAECRRPDWLECVTDKSFQQGKLRGRRWWFNSVKSERRKIERREWRKVERERRVKDLQEDFKRRRSIGLPVDEDIELARLAEEFRKAQHADDEEPIYKPEKQSECLGIYYHINPNIGDENMAKSFFMHMGDYDAGYIYECKCTRPEVGGFHGVPPTPPFKKDEDDVAVKCWLLSDDDDFLLFGMADGSIRVMPRVDVQAKIEEMMKLEEEEARKKKKSKDHDHDRDGDDSDHDQDHELDDKTEFDTEATTAPPITVDVEPGKAAADKKKRKSSKGGPPPFQPCIYPYDLESFFAIPMHDPNRGAVTQLAWSGDGQILISVGEDGSIFSYRWDPDSVLEYVNEDLPNPKLPTEALYFEFLPDEEDAYMLTVEETKQQEEKEKVRALQEEFKEDVRTELRDLREVFRNIKHRNKEIPEHYRLTEEELKLPDDIYVELQKKLDEEVEEVFRIHEYESAQTIVQLEKIDKHFFQPLLYPHIVIKDISHTIQTHTIRQKKLSQDFQALVAKNASIVSQNEVRSTFDLEVKMSDAEDETGPSTRVYAKDIIGEFEHKLSTYNIETIHNIRHLEKRLEERYYRELAWAELIKKKIGKDFIDPGDKERLDHAKSNRGAFNLQVSEKFLGDHSTIAERRQKIINMKLWIYESTREFNDKIIEARDEKRNILKVCRKLEEKIKLVQPYLSPELRRKIPPIFEMEQCEMPENIFDITQQDVESEENAELQAAGLLEFKDQLNEEMFKIMRPEKPLVMEDDLKDFMAPSVRHTKSVDLEYENMTVHKYRKYLFNPNSDREQTRLETMMWPKLIEQEMLFKELLQVIEYFHNRVKHLHDHRVQMDIDLHIKNIGLMTLIRELDIAKEFDTQEKGILERLQVQKEEFHDAHHRMEKVKKKITKMHVDIRKKEGEIASIQNEVKSIIGDKGKWQDYLWKVFNKKIKLDVSEEGTISEMLVRKVSSSDSSDASESTSQDTGSDLYKMPKMKLNINECPEHLDKTIYNKICDLRRRKAVVEMDIETEKRAVEKVGLDLVELERVYKTLEGRLTDTGQDIRVLQRRRQKRMNELKCMLILRIDQINCVDMDEVGDIQGGVFERLVKTFPSENKILVFPKGQTDKLGMRSQELMGLAEQERQRMKNGRQMHLRLIEELKKAEKRVEELKVAVKKDMVLKFGREVDLDKVCAALINLELLDKEIMLDKLRKYHYAQRQQAVDAILDAKEGLTGEIRENSNLKILEAMVLERRRDLDYFVWKVERDTEKKEIREASRRNLMASSRKLKLRNQDSLPRTNAQHPGSVVGLGQQFISPLDDEIQDLKDKIREMELRARALRNTLRICKRKSGLPPILHLTRNMDACEERPKSTSRNYKLPMLSKDKQEVCAEKTFQTPVQELPALNQYCSPLVDPKLATCGVRTLYESDQKGKIGNEMTIPPSAFSSQAEIRSAPPGTPGDDEEEIRMPQSVEQKEKYPDEFAGEDSAVRIFEEQFQEYLETEKKEVLEFLGEDDEEMISALFAGGDHAQSPEEESDMEATASEGEEGAEEEEALPAEVKESVTVMEKIRKYSQIQTQAAQSAAGWEAELEEEEDEEEFDEDNEG